jgi:hypothetical protein
MSIPQRREYEDFDVDFEQLSCLHRAGIELFFTPMVNPENCGFA